MAHQVEGDFIVYGTDLSLEEALKLSKDLIRRKGGSPHRVHIGESILFFSCGLERFAITCEGGFHHLRKKKSFHRKVKRALGDALDTITKDID